MNAGNKPMPRIERPSTKAQQLTAQRGRLEDHERAKWERVQFQRRSEGLEVLPFPGMDELEALRKEPPAGAGEGKAEEAPPPGMPPQKDVADAFKTISEQSKQK